ncbi:MAG: hypothetical protein AB1798_18215 [Spirochaetota bacterium]
MRTRTIVGLIIAILVITAMGCSTVQSALSAVESGQKVAAVAEVADLKSGEVLCAYGQADSVFDPWYGVATVLTKASEATKNQAEVLFVASGDKSWTEYVIPSHKAKKDELVVGAVVFYLSGYGKNEKVSADSYRKSDWGLGRVTSTDEMFKNLVEVNGDKYYWQWIRLPDQPVE